VVAEPALNFGELLRQLRAEARLTQEELAEAAGLSARSVSDLERGINRTAHMNTALLLADALKLPEPVRMPFVAAARRRRPVADVLAARQGMEPATFAAAATRSLPHDLAAFTGRQPELELLLATIDAASASGAVVGIHAIDGMAGIGKTTFAVHAAHRLAGSFPDGQFFLPLHAHTAGQRPVDPADALASLLLTAGVPAAAIPPGLEARAGRWRDQLAGKKILLLLDDAAAHDQVRPLLPGTAGSVVLVTSRRRLAALEDAVAISLDVLTPGEARSLLARLAGRPGLQSGDAAVGEMSRLCGYLPLALGMLASQLRHHPARTAAGLAADLAAATNRLAFMRAEDLSVAAAFGLSYAELTGGAQKLFRRLGLLPGPSFDVYAAAALAGIGPDDASSCLDELYDLHLITEPAPGRYQLHDLLREHARAVAAGEDRADSDAATGRLLDYYLYTTLAACGHIPELTATRRRPPGQTPAWSPLLATLEQAVTWLETERPNLQAAAGHAPAVGRAIYTSHLAAAMSDFMRAHAPWDQAAALQRTALAAASEAEDIAGQAIALDELGYLSLWGGDFPTAADSLTRAVALYSQAGNLRDQAIALCHLGDLQSTTGDYPASAITLKQALARARAAHDLPAEGLAHEHLGILATSTGDLVASAQHLNRALALYRRAPHRQGEADALQYLGKLQTLTGDYSAAATNIGHAVEMFRELGDRGFQAQALNNLGMVQQLTREYAAAAASHREAVETFREIGWRGEEANALNSLGELYSRTKATSPARDYYSQALAIARDIGAPLEEARALEGLGQACLTDDDTSQAAALLRQALAIYQRIKAPATERVQEALQRNRLPVALRAPSSNSQTRRSSDPRT
jgi:tetratricopeptide (TPR) repeat protein/transcriptional regulator with XRE-family HTH domain